MNELQTPFEFVGKGKVLVDGKLVDAEFRFVTCKFSSDKTKITFDLIPQGEDQVLYDVTLKP